MSAPGEADLLPFYQRELAYLRNAGAGFALRYPRIAARLEIGEGEAGDPHVERLIESFAFLAARLQRTIERDFAEIPAALLGVLYPHLAEPIPPLTIARFEVDPTQGSLDKGYTIPRHTPLFTETSDGEVCRFRTAYPVTLWPLRLQEAGFESAERYNFLDRRPQVVSVLRLRLQVEGEEARFDKLALDRLRLHLAGDRAIAFRLYELLFTQCIDVVVLPEGDQTPRPLPAPALSPVGFDEEEALLPHPPGAHAAYRMLQEYFAFPDKFLFFDLTGLRGRLSGRSCDILFLLQETPMARMGVDHRAFSLGCAPVVNLFHQTSEPIRIDETQSVYRLVPDARRERTVEIHSILKVSAAIDPANAVRTYAPYFSCDHRLDSASPATFWQARRESSQPRGMAGTDLILSFLDLDFSPHVPPETTIFAHTLCTNRDLAEQIPGSALLQIEMAAPVRQIVTLDKPTRALAPPLEGETLWRLVSHLALNHLSLTNSTQGLTALREILRLYTPLQGAAAAQQIAGIRAMQCRPVTRRIGRDGWRGFCSGTEITLTFDERCYVGASAFLLASILNRFFALYASINSFTQLVARRDGQGGLWYTWPPMVGERQLL